MKSKYETLVNEAEAIFNATTWTSELDEEIFLQFGASSIGSVFSQLRDALKNDDVARAMPLLLWEGARIQVSGKYIFSRRHALALVNAVAIQLEKL